VFGGYKQHEPAGQISSKLQKRMNELIRKLDFLIIRQIFYKFSITSYLFPKHSMMSPVTVDLFLFEKAREAAFLIIAEPAMDPNTAGFLQLKRKLNY
jgi:hypothetical protein